MAETPYTDYVTQQPQRVKHARAIAAARDAVIAAAEKLTDEYDKRHQRQPGLWLDLLGTYDAVMAVRKLRALQQPAAPGESAAQKGRT
jgi:hypothetical protein